MSHLLAAPPMLASHLTGDPNTVVGWVFLGIVLTGVWLFATRVDVRRALWTAAGGWVVGIALLLVF